VKYRAMVKRKAQNAIAVVSIDIGKNRSRYWITMSKRQPEKTSIARRKLLAGGVVPTTIYRRVCQYG
jgi:hypothetical protein